MENQKSFRERSQKGGQHALKYPPPKADIGKSSDLRVSNGKEVRGKVRGKVPYISSIKENEQPYINYRMKSIITLSFTFLLSILLLTSCQTGKNLDKASVTTKLENAGYSLKNSEKLQHASSEESVDYMKELSFTRSSKTVHLLLIRFKNANVAMDQESLNLQTDLSRNRVTNRHAKGLVGRVYLMVFVDDKKDIDLAEETFSILVNPD